MKNRFLQPAFTMIEILVVLGIIGALLAITIPVVISVRGSAASTTCQNNLRQLALALLNYSTGSNGRFPPNTGESSLFWFDLERVLKPFGGVVVEPEDRQGKRSIMLCPNDKDASVRSYSMNVFASSAVSSIVQQSLLEETPPRGKLFNASSSPSSKLILVIEATASYVANSPELSAAPAVVGWGPRFPGHRFGAAPATQRWWQVDYSRHARDRDTRADVAVGKINIAFLDGHVEQFAHTDLADFATTKSKYVALWSENDADIENSIPPVSQ